LGPAVGKVAALLGKPFMPWQQHVADVVLEVDPDTGGLVYNEFRITVPRQSGKSTWLLAKAVHRASATQFFGSHQQIVYTAQTRKDSRRKWEEDYLEILKQSRVFRSKINEHLGNGNEHIRFPNRSRFGIESTTEKAGHGSTLDEAYLDEAFALQDGRMEQAFGPAMITRRNTQFGVISTAGWLDASPYLEAKVAHSRSQVEMGVRTGVASFEWSAPENADPFDPAVWRGCMPALGIRRPDGSGITEDAIRAELTRFESSPEGLNGFRRAYLNQWVPKGAAADSLFDPGLWDSRFLRASEIRDVPALALDVNPERSWTSIVAAGPNQTGKTHVEVVDRREGTHWAVQAAAELVRTHRSDGIAVDRTSPAASLIPPLRAAGVKVHELGVAEYKAACGGFYDGVVDGSIAHIGQPELNAAVAGAQIRTLSDAMGWKRRHPAIDISPLVGASLAAYRANNKPQSGWMVSL
jgi:phage terminase large subunit-like protein